MLLCRRFIEIQSRSSLLIGEADKDTKLDEFRNLRVDLGQLFNRIIQRQQIVRIPIRHHRERCPGNSLVRMASFK